MSARSELGRLWLAAPAAAILAMAVGCSRATQLPLRAAPGVPAAEGSVKVGEGEDGNTKVEVEVKHLAPAEQVAPGATTYVVWAKPDVAGAQPQNLGTMAIDKSLNGDLETITPFRRFELMVTPEATPEALAPTGQPVLRTFVQR
jgi:hypothetical protein